MIWTAGRPRRRTLSSCAVALGVFACGIGLVPGVPTLTPSADAAPVAAEFSWSAPVSVSHAGPPATWLSASLSCVSDTFCVAVDFDGTAITYNGTTWSAPVPVASVKLYAVSCASASFCVAVGEGSQAATFDGSSWSAPVTVRAGGSTLSALSCVSTTFCVAADWSGNAMTFDGATWSAPVVLGSGKQIRTLSCVSTTYCVAVDNSGGAMVFNGIAWTAPTPFRAGKSMQALSCVAGPHCVGIDNGGATVTFDGTWHVLSTASSGVWTLSCASSTFCMGAVGGGTVKVFNGSTWGAAAPALASSYFNALSCPSASFCGGITYDGRASTGTLHTANYVPLTPARVFDTRTGSGGAPKAKIAARHAIRVKVAGVKGVPADASAVVLNVTAVGATQPTFVTVYPYGSSRPHASSLNVSSAAAVANGAIVKVGSGGYISVYNDAGSTNVVADVQGYFRATAAYHGINPARLFDTRTGAGAPKGPIGAHRSVRVKATGTHGVPASATAVVLNVTAVGATQSTFVTVYPYGSSRPYASSLNVSSPAALANLVTVKVGSGGYINVYNDAGSSNVLADIQGYFGTGGDFHAMAPVRAFDTRTGTGVRAGKVKPGDIVKPKIAGTHGIPSDAVAVVLNLTAVNASYPTFISVFPSGSSWPGTSTINVNGAGAVANFAIVPIGAGGAVAIYNDRGGVDVLADVVGYMKP